MELQIQSVHVVHGCNIGKTLAIKIYLFFVPKNLVLRMTLLVHMCKKQIHSTKSGISYLYVLITIKALIKTL